MRTYHVSSSPLPLFGKKVMLTTTRNIDAGVNAAIGRYVDFLHMLSEHKEEDLLAPLDVEMVWLSHLIRTEDYRTTSLYFGSLINHNMGRERHDDEQRKRNTSKPWKRYGAMKLYDFNLDVGYPGRLKGSNMGYFGLRADSILRDRQWFKYFVRDLKQARQRWLCKMRRESLRSENELSLWENLNDVDWFCKLVKEDKALANTMLTGKHKDDIPHTKQPLLMYIDCCCCFGFY